MPTLHPSYLLRDQSMMPVVISDLQKSLVVIEGDYNTNPTLSEVQDFHAKVLTFDIETNRFTNQITMVGVTDKAHKAICIPFKGAYIGELKRIFNEAEELVNQNVIAFDIPHLQQAGVITRPFTSYKVWDIMLMHHLVQPDLAHDLEFIASIFANMQAWKHLKGQDEAWYNCADVDAARQIYDQLKPLLKVLKLDNLYHYCQVPLALICTRMSETGVKVEPKNIEKVRTQTLAELVAAQKNLPPELQPYEKAIRVRQLAPPGTLGKSGKPIKFIHIPGTEEIVPWQSPKQVEKYLYETLALPQQVHAHTKKITTDKTAIARLIKTVSQWKDTKENKATVLANLKAIKDVRALDELISTFLKTGDNDEQVATGRIHTDFLVHGTNTGRLASSGPNLQNIPPKARYIYVPSHVDWCFVEADFSSLENRLAAYFANDEDRLRRFSLPGYNEHRWLASKIFNIPESEVDKKSDEYGRAKHTNHGADAGMGPRKMSVQYDIPERDCRTLLEMWRRLNHKSAEWQTRIGETAQREGLLTNPFGRKRWFWCVAPETRVLTTNLQWKPIGDIIIGQKLIGFDEKLQSPKYRETEVLDTQTFVAPRYEIVTDKGTVICTPNHKWPVRLSVDTGGSRRYLHRWLTTESLQVGDSLVWFGRPWNEDTSSLAGWLGGFLDGEGTVNHQGRGDIRFAQKSGNTLDWALDTCQQLGIQTTNRHQTGLRLGSNVESVRLVVDSPRSALEIVGRIPTYRLRNNARGLWEGKSVWGNTTRHEVATVMSIKKLDDGPVVAIRTSTGTFIAEGILSHNSHSAYTEGIRFILQGSGADICIRSMVGLYYDRIGWPEEFARRVSPVVCPLPSPARLVLQVHDSLLVEGPYNQVDDIRDCMTKVMTQSWPELGGFSIPIAFKVGAPGESWGELKEVN